ncbi:hypothetical protein [Bacteroides acidifaciens]|uniref:hypothetical protein n=1 Tax=Bacteroides acidifaciens TaxID=85831 RepID=UPI00259B7E41|nr:hypothetical protein [Bacteroides acidifaciens]
MEDKKVEIEQIRKAVSEWKENFARICRKWLECFSRTDRYGKLMKPPYFPEETINTMFRSNKNQVPILLDY